MVLEKNKMASDARWFSKKNNAITRLRDAYVGTRMLPRKTLSRGLFENPVYTLRGETTCPRVNIPASQHQREGPGRNFNRKGLPRASPKSDKSTFLVRTFIPGAMTICYFWTTHDTSPTCVVCTKLHPATAHITQRMQQESVWSSPLCGQSNRLR